MIMIQRRKKNGSLKDLFKPKTSPIALGNDEEDICEYINNHINDLHIVDFLIGK